MRNFRLLLIVLPFVCLLSCGEDQRKKNEEKPAEEQKTASEPERDERELILFFGNSLTAGLGLAPEEAFPALIQKKIDSLGLPFKVLNAGLSGETTAGGKNRIGWVLKQEVGVFVLELGANDSFRGVPVAETRKNLQAIIDTVREKDPETDIILAGMQMPPSLGQEYTRDFREIFPMLAEENDIHLIPFLLEDVGGVPELNQEDGIHPTAEGQRILAENVWAVLKPILMERQAEEGEQAA